jgi:hypothetical protein
MWKELSRREHTQTMAQTVKFATIPVKYAPKRKMIDFSLPQWRYKFTETANEDVLSWVHRMYQSKTFTTQAEFNKAYDERNTYMLRWDNKPMVLTAEDVSNFEEELCGEQGVMGAEKWLTKMRAFLETGEKVVFVY